MNHFTLEECLGIVGDEEAIERGYITPEILLDAEALAKAVLLMPTFGRYGSLDRIGGCTPWWEENCAVFAELKNSDRYKDRHGRHKSRHFSNMCEIAGEMIEEEFQSILQNRYQALKILESQLSKEEKREMQDIGKILKNRHRRYTNSGVIPLQSQQN